MADGERIRLLLEAIGEEDGYRLLRQLLLQPRTQEELIADTQIGQSKASSLLRGMRLLGIVKLNKRTYRVVHWQEAWNVLLAADDLRGAIAGRDDAEHDQLRSDYEAGEPPSEE